MHANSSLLRRDPTWRPYRHMDLQRLPLVWQSWLGETGSLTQRLRSEYGEISVEILQQGWRQAFASERRLLPGPDQRLWLREVVLSVPHRPLIVARTVIPAMTIRNTQHRLLRLGNRPLGDVMFRAPSLTRAARQWTIVPVYAWRAGVQGTWKTPVCGRRTLYRMAGQPLLVSEFFLPALWQTFLQNGDTKTPFQKLMTSAC